MNGSDRALADRQSTHDHPVTELLPNRASKRTPDAVRSDNTRVLDNSISPPAQMDHEVRVLAALKRAEQPDVLEDPPTEEWKPRSRSIGGRFHTPTKTRY